MRDAISAETLAGQAGPGAAGLGRAGAFRRYEPVKLDVRDLKRLPEGLRITIRRSKTDQERAGQVTAILRGSKLRPVCAVRAGRGPPNMESLSREPIKADGKAHLAGLIRLAAMGASSALPCLST